MSAGGPEVQGATAKLARKENWDCQWIGRAVDNLVISMQKAKAQAEVEQTQMPKTVELMAGRLFGPPGAGNGALAEYQAMRSDAVQLNDLLKEKGCATHDLEAQAPEDPAQ